MHETAHQVLHSWMSKEDFEENKETIEREAEIFASCFLMPSESMAKERFVVDSLEGLLHLKRRWGASAQAILYHLKLLELIDIGFLKGFVQICMHEVGGKKNLMMKK